jgi:hypothetical protein
MEETKSEYLKALRETQLNEEEVSSEYLERCKAFANFIIENDCKQQGEDEDDE